jgi:hypothetical protein
MSQFRIVSLVKSKILRHSVQQIFSTMYRRNSWGNKGSVSGHGSDLIQTATIRREIANLSATLGIKTMLDAPCGDYYWMKEVPMDLTSYVGADIVAEMIESNQRQYGSSKVGFRVLDIMKDDLPRVDLILCRDCLVHLPLQAAASALRNFVRSGSKYLLTTTYPGALKRNEQLLITGNWRPLDLQLPPFSLPEPVRVINEECTQKDDYREKSLGLWALEQLQIPS